MKKKVADTNTLKEIGPAQSFCLAITFVAREDYERYVAQADNKDGTIRNRHYGERHIKEFEEIFNDGAIDDIFTLLGMTSEEMLEQIKKACPRDSDTEKEKTQEHKEDN